MAVYTGWAAIAGELVYGCGSSEDEAVDKAKVTIREMYEHDPPHPGEQTPEELIGMLRLEPVTDAQIALVPEVFDDWEKVASFSGAEDTFAKAVVILTGAGFLLSERVAGITLSESKVPDLSTSIMVERWNGTPATADSLEKIRSEAEGLIKAIGCRVTVSESMDDDDKYDTLHVWVDAYEDLW